MDGGGDKSSFWKSKVGVVVKDTLSGGIGGVIGITLGYPLDTVKVRLQVEGKKFSGILDCFSKTLKNEGFKGLFQGIASPISGYAVSNAISFSIYGQTLRFLRNYHPTREEDRKHPIVVSSLESCFAGGMAGIGLTLVNNPLDRVKILMQSQLRHQNLQFSNAFACAKWMIRNQGARGFYYGWTTNVFVQIFGGGIWFGTYQCTKLNFIHRFDISPSNVPIPVLIVSGGMAGLVSWALIFPGDVIRSRMMREVDVLNPKFKNGWRCLSHCIESEGYGWCYRGLLPTLIRAVPVGAVILSVNELVHKWLDSLH